MERLGIEIVAVTFEARERAEEYVRETGLPWPLLIDRRRVLYNAYGMGRGRPSAIWGPATWWAYIRLIGRGRRLRRPTGDIHQLGGDVLVDLAGRVALHHVGKGPADRPAVDALFDRVRQGRRDFR
ncbi:MAG: redoxin domain-containing protein [Candidatus Rokubacteria bacterium]|nr:redoxin domain-containing protein [Candidatus Rokubacteria bacterium]